MTTDEVRTALSAPFTQDIGLSEAGQQRRPTVQRTGQLGVTVRAVVFALIGQFGRRGRPRRTGGLRAALDTLACGPYGQGLPAPTAAGLIASGLYRWVLSLYR